MQASVCGLWCSMADLEGFVYSFLCICDMTSLQGQFIASPSLFTEIKVVEHYDILSRW